MTYSSNFRLQIAGARSGYLFSRLKKYRFRSEDEMIKSISCDNGCDQPKALSLMQGAVKCQIYEINHYDLKDWEET